MKKTNSRSIAGFTLDQTILVVAVIAILATIIISSVAWNVLNKANATKLTAHLNQYGDAIGTYYRDNESVWPTNAQNLAIYLTGYPVSGQNLLSPFGGSSASTMSLNSTGIRYSTGGACSVTTPEYDCYITVSLTNVQVKELRESNTAIDGKAESDAARSTSGRLRWSADANENDRVTATYLAAKKSS